MKSLKTTLVLFLTLLVIFLFIRKSGTSQVKPITEIPYNRDSALVHYISLKDAAELTANFRSGKTELARQLKEPGYLDRNFNLPLAGKFNRDAIAVLLNRKGAVGIRIYLGKDKDGFIKFVLVGVDSKGNDITGNGAPGEYVLDASLRCPPMCSPGGILIKSPDTGNKN